MRLFFLFAPVFNHSAVSIVRNLAEHDPEIEVDGLITGRKSIHRSVSEGLGGRAGELFDLDDLERRWLGETPPPEAWESAEAAFDTSAVNRVLVADRQVGCGFVGGGRQPRSGLIAHMRRHPRKGPRDYLCHVLSWCLATLRARRPNAVFLYAVAGAPAMALVEAARALDIPVRVMTPVRLERQYMVDDDPYGRLLRGVRLYQRARNDHDLLSQDNRARARSYIDSFRERPSVPEYIRQNNRQLQRLTPFRTALRLVAKLPRVIRHADRDTLRAPRLGRGAFELATAIRRQTSNRLPQPALAREPLSGRYFYFPLHVDPEASTMVMSPGHTDQIAVIEGLAKSLPLDATLVVKEHGSMIGRRPSGFYRRIARLPRVAVVPAQWSSFELIRDAALVCAITGTAAWEAALLGVPVLVMGQPHYAYLPQGVMRCTDLSALPETVPAALAQTACPEIDLELFIAAMYQRSFAMPPGFIWGDAPVEPADWDGCARAYARAIIDSLTLEDDHALAR